MKSVPLVLLGLLVGHAFAEPSCLEGGTCEDADDEGAEKYSRERNKPQGIVDQMALLKNALVDLMKDPYNPDVLRSSLAELAMFAETKEGEKFMEQFGAVMDGKGGGASGAIVRQLFTAVLSGNIEMGTLMKEGVSATSLAKLASGLLSKDTGKAGQGMKTEDLLPILKHFMQVIKDEQASPFLMDRLTEAFKDTMSESELRKFERTAAGVLGGIRSLQGDDDDSNFQYDESALETFESFMKDFVEEQNWDWSKNGDTFMKEIKKVMRIFTGSEDQIGRLLPSMMEVIAEANPTPEEREDIIKNFGGVLGNVVKKDSAEPDFVNLLLKKLKVPLEKAKVDAIKKGLKTEAKKVKASEDDVAIEIDEEEEILADEEEELIDEKTNVIEDEEDTPPSQKKSETPSADAIDDALKKADSAFDDVPDISKLADSLTKLGSDPMAMQEIMLKLASSGGDLKSIASSVPELEGLQEISDYMSRMQETGNEKEIAAHFHKIMDSVADAFSLMRSEDMRKTAIEQALPYIRMAHDFLKEPMAMLKINMGVASLTSMYDTSVPKIIDMAAPVVEDFAAPLGIMVDFKEFCNDAHKFLLKVYNEVYQSPKSELKKLKGMKEDDYIVNTMDHSVAEPLIEAYTAYRQIRRQPECLLQTLCSANRKVAESDAGKYGVRTAFMKYGSRLFGVLLASSEHTLDSPVHEQLVEAINEAHGDGNCERLYPADCEEVTY